MKKHDAVLWIGFAVNIFLQCTMKTSQWNILTVFTTAMGVVLLIKTGRPSGKHMVISAVLAVLAAAAYLGYKRDPAVLIYGLISAGIPTLISMSAVFSVMEKYGGYQFINRKGKHPVLISLAIAVIIGAGLSVINQMLLGEKGEAGFSLWKLLLALNPGIFEEAACRAVFMAYCIRFSEGRKMGIGSAFTMYFMMFIPHAAAHGFGLRETVMIGLMFGLPFTIMQRKLDIASSMVSHWLVDVVRFVCNGI